MKTIKDIMAESPECCEKTDTLQTAAKKMFEKNIGSLPVVDKERNVLGMLTDRDIAIAVGKNGKRPVSGLMVSDAMVTKVHTISSADSIENALKTMRTNKVGRLPVVDEQKKLQGIISLNRVASKIKGEKEEEEIESKGTETVLKTLQSIAERNEEQLASI